MGQRTVKIFVTRTPPSGDNASPYVSVDEQAGRYRLGRAYR